MALRPCKVIVVGGGVAGLAIALMLEKHGIDYLLLEAYSDIVATVGAGIALSPNGLRILDQLGCYEDILSHSASVDQMHARKPGGEVIWGMEAGLEEGATKRHGYPWVWMDRKSLLEVLYDHIADKSKLLTGKRLVSVTHTETGDVVVTADGSTYAGDIVVGTDGTHSAVRKEIAKRAEEMDLGEDYAEQNKVAASYSCLFGMSDSVPGFPSRCLEFVANEGFSYVLGTGPNDRVYWFIVNKLDQIYYGADIPRFTDEDKEKILQDHMNDQITPDIRLSDLYSRALTTSCTPMAEFVYKNWHLGRMITIGDACHKVLPITAQGGNQAIESAAAVVNGLARALSQDSSLGPLSESEIKSMFDQVQDLRFARMTQIVKQTNQRQQMEAMETPELKHFLLNVYAGLMPGAMWSRWEDWFAAGVSLKRLAIPTRPRTVLFLDEIAPVEANL
ncbi:FAD/NAD(P)-binding domain-containing protein [Aspergillus sclerotioniger CBS 115572]|uniref:FAD/NAD(P)-binding domain-containing protein n=1 Tax=Aspergillus sclerotioniger CBS 115572 TaxID=1450535 RepID=A0A317X600_9EURO|nr:FAD/NAD(P)-binding domain-containing protein [Aspergillus sclerotioniger CBS 115572]PWY91990.1 FAD/NAD(P)-binding domain-containing protein [Aspergillus sclerotioniger CBS 115572]